MFIKLVVLAEAMYPYSTLDYNKNDKYITQRGVFKWQSLN